MEVHGNRSPSTPTRCTETVQFETRRGARFFVHLEHRKCCTVSVHLKVHHRGCDIGIPSLYRGYPIRSCTGVHERRKTPYRVCVRGYADRGLRRNPLTARAWSEVPAL